MKLEDKIEDKVLTKNVTNNNKKMKNQYYGLVVTENERYPLVIKK